MRSNHGTQAGARSAPSPGTSVTSEIVTTRAREARATVTDHCQPG